MTLKTYVNFAGNCAEAFRYYETHLGGKVGMMMTHAQSPQPSPLPAEWKDAVLHARIARSLTDFVYAAYLSDLAVDRSLQRSGVGKELVRRTQAALGPRCTLILLAAPLAVDYYARIGFERHPQAWILRPGMRVAD